MPRETATKKTRERRAVRYGFLLKKPVCIRRIKSMEPYGTNLFAYMGLVYLNTIIIQNQAKCGGMDIYYGNGFD